MFCPKCGNPDQTAESYCRRCGVFLPDLSKPLKKETTPDEDLKVNTVLTLMTVIVSFTLALLLYIFLGFRSTTHPLIYATAGLLIAMGAWHIQTFIRTRRLRKRWKLMRPQSSENESEANHVTSAPTRELSAASQDFISPSVTEQTTRNLVPKTPER